MKELYSFDIFDTLITRRTATPKGIFALMQECLFEMPEWKDLPDKLRNNFYILRAEAERVARYTYQVDGVEDLTLPMIYDCMKLLECLTLEQADRLMKLEIRTEYENALPIRSNIEKVKTLLKDGRRVVLITDMYLEAKTIRGILALFDDVFTIIPIYVSGEIGKTKRSSSLYHHVKEKEQVEFTNWRHYGDNVSSDVEIPKMLGIDAVQYRGKNLLFWEKELLTNHEDCTLRQILIGTSSQAMVGQETDFPYKAGCGFTAQLLLPYVLWILEESMKNGIRKLYFIARDGYILKRMADIMIVAYQYPIRTEYLYGSRRAWRLPSVTEENFDLKELFRWSNPSRIYNYDQIAKILGMTVEELQLFLPCATSGRDWLSPSQVQEAIGVLALQQKKIASHIREKYLEKRNEAQGYLKQELGEEKERFAFVELIGSGYSQKSLQELIGAFRDRSVTTFFYRLDSGKEYEGMKNYTFFANRLEMGHAIEVLCGAPHGQTNGYAYTEDGWQPVFGQDEGQLLEGYGFDSYLKGIEDYVTLFCNLYSDQPPTMKNLAAISAYYSYWTEGTCQELSDFFADMPYSITGREQKAVAFAPKLSDAQLRKIFFTHKGENACRYYNGNGVQFSLKRLTKRQIKLYDFYARHGEDAWIKWMRRNIFMGQGFGSRYELLAPEIIIYGAGKRGKLLHEQLTSKRKWIAHVLRKKESSLPHVKAWVDKDFARCQKEGMPVESPEMLIGGKYQQIVVAVASKELAEKIMEELTATGIESWELFWLNPTVRF